MKEIITANIANKIKPLVAEAMDFISNLMENPAEFISHGYWTIPHDFEFSEECNNICSDLTISEHSLFYSWIRNWLNANGWGFAHCEPCECAVENDFQGSRIFPLSGNDTSTT